jgi:hypothetical protein
MKKGKNNKIIQDQRVTGKTRYSEAFMMSIMGKTIHSKEGDKDFIASFILSNYLFILENQLWITFCLPLILLPSFCFSYS